MSDLSRVPPGRSGRLWLRSRLRTARQAVDLLERKLQILRAEQERFALLSRRTRQRWRTSWRSADSWGVRAALLGGPREMRLSAASERAQVSVSWTSVMGLRYPAQVTCRMPEPAAGDRSPGSAAVVEAAAAYRTALDAAVAHAAAESARRAVESEVAATRRRRRAIANRWVPGLERALRQLTAELEEAERAETVRLRWAASRIDR